MNTDTLRYALKNLLADKFTQAELSRRSGVPTSVISLFVTGKRPGLSAKNFCKLWPYVEAFEASQAKVAK